MSDDHEAERHVLGDDLRYLRFPYDELLHRIGMYHTRIASPQTSVVEPESGSIVPPFIRSMNHSCSPVSASNAMIYASSR